MKRIISDKDLAAAAAAVRKSMLLALPEPENCTGVFSRKFEEKTEKLKRMWIRKEHSRQWTRSVVAALIWLMLGFSVLFAVNTEVRAAVVGWFKETFGTYTAYWFDGSEEKTLPEYELTWVPEGYEIVYEDQLPNQRNIVYQCGDDVNVSFIFSYYFTEESSPLRIHTFDGEYTIEEIQINGCEGEFYHSLNTTDSSCLVWFDEQVSIVFTLNTTLSLSDAVEIAKNIEQIK